MSDQLIQILDNTPELLKYILGASFDKVSIADKEKISHAIDLTRETHKGQLRASGDPYFVHPVRTAQILADFCPDTDGIIAALLHDTIEDCNLSPQVLQDTFGETVLMLIEGVTKISNLHFYSKHEEKSENLRKMILAMGKDLRVIFIKLADRLHNMQTMEYLRAEKRTRISQDTLSVYAPLANRLGMTRMRCQLEDLAMRWVHALEYHDIASRISATHDRDEKVVTMAREQLEHEMQQAGIKAEVLGRTKHIYSIYRKMQKRNLDFDEICDIIGVRVICTELKHCYDVLGIAHQIWHPVHGMFDDYISVPKENGYQSLHTTVIGPLGSRLEVQIRTVQMNINAEEGMAAHWSYKEGGHSDENIIDRIARIRRTVDTLLDAGDPNNFMDAFTKDVFQDRVFVFTPQGDVIDMPVNATPLDFAYYVHSKVGDHCQGAKVNDKIATLKQKLQNGDRVEIITSPHTHPVRDWLQIAKTARAWSRIRHYLRTCEYEINFKRGKEMLARTLRVKGLNTDWASIESHITPHIKILRVTKFENAIAEIGLGTLTTAQIISRCWAEDLQAKQAKTPKVPNKSIQSAKGVIVGGISNAEIRFAKCCNPLPGEDIVGYVTVGKGVTIHTTSCKNITKLKGRSPSGRVLVASWDLMNPTTRSVQVRLECNDRKGLLSDLAGVIASENISISGVNSESRDNVFHGLFTLEISGSSQLSRVCKKLSQSKGVIRVTRLRKSQSL
ncbi:bifunctional (p)ppGpp synthetase/guanosine-3',5'-bis(diphosphate) 3'-pyrophosphohydrolase [Candidatus Sumerlaeota bacterium]|nr:bifunctional (p)ppGpp synthetase/guanosine-3',5'-bis(diphosphate) 3'-pyrophosphohydrolase [Candidatus Sumerlaeota bacterium]